MSCDVTLRARIATARAVLRGRPTEAQRVDSFVSAIRATATAPAIRPLVLADFPTQPLRRMAPAQRTDTVLMPRIVLTAGAQL